MSSHIEDTITPYTTAVINPKGLFSILMPKLNQKGVKIVSIIPKEIDILLRIGTLFLFLVIN